MQETWAIHGVYPAMAWTPDSKSVVFWAGGKIQRVDVGGEAGRDDPVPREGHAQARSPCASVRRLTGLMQASAARRTNVPRPKMLRWVAVSPDGKRVVYQALGHSRSATCPTARRGA